MIAAHFSDGFSGGIWASMDVEARERLESYMADLLHYNRAQNLVSRKEPARRIAALVEECVVAGQAIEAHSLSGRWADVGSGGGAPGLILGCLFPEHRFMEFAD